MRARQNSLVVGWKILVNREAGGAAALGDAGLRDDHAVAVGGPASGRRELGVVRDLELVGARRRPDPSCRCGPSASAAACRAACWSRACRRPARSAAAPSAPASGSASASSARGRRRTRPRRAPESSAGHPRPTHVHAESRCFLRTIVWGGLVALSGWGHGRPVGPPPTLDYMSAGARPRCTGRGSERWIRAGRGRRAGARWRPGRPAAARPHRRAGASLPRAAGPASCAGTGFPSRPGR